MKKMNRAQKLDKLFEGSIQNHDFQIYLQAKMGRQDGGFKGAEALVRWIHTSQGIIYPSVKIKYAVYGNH